MHPEQSRCPSCGAPASPSAETCGYCHAPTPWAPRLRWEREQQKAAQQNFQQHAEFTQEQQRRGALHQQMQAASQAALFWSFGSLVCCMLPVPGVVALIKALNARKIARELGLATPNGALVAIVLGGLSVVLGIAVWTGTYLTERERDQRIEALEAELDDERSGKRVDTTTACRLVELYVLREKPSGLSVSDGVDCDGAVLRTEGDKVFVDEVKLLGTKPVKVSACLRKGQKWVVDELTRDGLCGVPKPSPESGASASASASASGSTQPAAGSAEPAASASASP